MSVSLRHVLHQGPVLRSLVGAAAAAVGQKLSKGSAKSTPGPWLTQEVTPRPPRLVVDYIHWTGGDLSQYNDELPPHLFPQWGFPLIAKTLQGIPYPLAGVLNQGCQITRKEPLDKTQPLQLKARLEDIDDNGQRARLHQRLVTGTALHPEALICDIYAVVRLQKSGGKKKREKPTVPADAVVAGERGFGARAGLDFALLTGDFNPIHWIKPAAKMAGFKSTILHGFASLAVATELLNTHLQATSAPAWTNLDVRFIKPLVLPNQVTLHVAPPETEAPESPENTEKSNDARLFLTNKAGDICMLGTFR